MATVTIKGSQIETYGNLPLVGSAAPEFKLISKDLEEITLDSLKGKKIILNIFPSIDTPVCATSTRRFNKEAASLKNTIVVCVSADLPFAAGRFCSAEGIDNVKTGSVFRDDEFGKKYGVEMVTGPFSQLLSRAVVIIDEAGKIIYTEQVSEIADEPNYEAALKSVS